MNEDSRHSHSKEKSKTETESPKEITIGDYIIKKTIGSGTFSTVKLGIHRITQKKVAIKILDKYKIESRDDLERIIREMQILTEMNNPFVIKVYKIYEDKNNFLIIMEYCEGGELFNYIVKKKRLTEDESSYFFFQLINGIEYIHSKGIAHRDLKPENLLISKNKILKIIDFGLSNFYDGQKRLQTPCGSPCYASPEMVKGKKYDGFNIDIWAIGVILFAMLCGYLPFEDDENDTDVLFNEIIRNKIDYPYFLSDLSLDILQRILVSDPLKRITIEEIKDHEFYLKGERIFRNKFEEIKRENEERNKNTSKEKEKNIDKEKEIIKDEKKEIIKDEKKDINKDEKNNETEKKETKEVKEIKEDNNDKNNKQSININNNNTPTGNKVIVNNMFTKIDKKEINNRNTSKQKGPITIILKNGDDNKYRYHLFTTKFENIISAKNLILICSIFYEEIFNTVLSNTQIPIRNNFQILEDTFINSFNKSDKKISLALILNKKECKIIRAGKGLSSFINENLFELFPIEFKQYQIDLYE